MLMPPPELRTERLWLRPVTVDDAAVVHAAVAASRPDLGRWMAWAARATLGSAESSLHTAEQMHLLGTACHYGLFRNDGLFLGRASLDPIHSDNASAELGYWLRSDQRGQGYMSEALAAVLEYALREHALHRVTAYVDTQNATSQRLLERLGFEREGTLRHYIRHPETGWRDHHVYGLLAGELEREWDRGESSESEPGDVTLRG